MADTDPFWHILESRDLGMAEFHAMQIPIVEAARSMQARIAELEAALAERTRERDEARVHFTMVTMHFPDSDLTIRAAKQLAVKWLREHDAAIAKEGER